MRLQNSKAEIVDMSLAGAVAQTRAGMTEPLAEIMRAHNQRLYRIARGIVKDHGEAEDIVQESFIKAFTNAADLRDENKIGPWLGKIVVNMARDRLRSLTRRSKIVEFPDDFDVIPINRAFQEENDQQNSPERLTAMRDVRVMIEQEVDQLPDGFREVFVMRTVEQMSQEETAEILELPVATVKTRLHRAKKLLRKALSGRLDAQSLNAFPFGGVHCERTTRHVIKYLQENAPKT